MSAETPRPRRRAAPGAKPDPLPEHPGCRCSTAPLPARDPGPPCPVCGAPVFSRGAAAVLLTRVGFSPVCGDCAAVFAAAGLPRGEVLAGSLPGGATLSTVAFLLPSAELQN